MRHVELREWGARNYFPCTDQYQIQLILTSTDQISVSIWRTIHVATLTVFTVNDFTRARLKFKIHDQLIRTKDFSPLPHPLRNPPPSHLLHKSLLPSPPCTSYTIHPSPLTQATLSLTSSTLHPFPHLSCNPPLPSPLIQSTPPLPARLTQLTPPRTSYTTYPSPALPPYHIGSLRTGRFPVHCTPQHPMNCPWGNTNFTVDAPLQWNDWGTACEVRSMNLSLTLHFTPPEEDSGDSRWKHFGISGLEMPGVWDKVELLGNNAIS